MNKLTVAAVGAMCLVTAWADESDPTTRVFAVSEATNITGQALGTWNKATIDADLTMDNSTILIGYAGAALTVGENAAQPVVVTVTNAPVRAFDTYLGAPLAFKGWGGRVDVHATTESPQGWGTKYTGEDVTARHTDWPNNAGTFGRQLALSVELDADKLPAVDANGERLVDIAHLYAKGSLGMASIANKTPGTVARVLYDGGYTYLGHAGSVFLQPAANTEIRLESVSGKLIYFGFNYPNGGKFSEAADYPGLISTAGDGDFLLGPGNTTEPKIQLKGNVAWNHKGDFYIVGNTLVQMYASNWLPYGTHVDGTSRGTVYIKRKCTKHGLGTNDANYPTYLDLRGLSQRVNAIVADTDGTEGAWRVSVTNSLAQRATLEVGEFVSATTVKGQFIGAIDVVKKGTSAVTLDTVTLGAGATLSVADNSAVTLVKTAFDLAGTNLTVTSLAMDAASSVLNSSAMRSTLTFAPSVAPLTIKGRFDGPIDLVKTGDGDLTVDGVTLTGGAKLTIHGGTVRFVNVTDYSNIVTDPGVSLEPMTNELHAAYVIAADLRVCTTVTNVHVKGLTPSGVGVAPNYSRLTRDLPPAFAHDAALLKGRTLEIAQGALVATNFTAAADTVITVATNAGLRLQSHGTRDVAGKYLRFTVKETLTRQLFSLARVSFAKADRTNVFLSDTAWKYTLDEQATSPSDLAKGTYMYNTANWYEGNGVNYVFPAGIVDWAKGSYTSQYYTYGKDSLFKNDNVMLSFNDTIPSYDDESTWKVITIRFKDDMPPLAGYRLFNQWNIHSHPSSWTVELSDDGATWTTIDDRTKYLCFSYTTGAGNPSNPLTEGYQWLNHFPHNNDYGSGTSLGEGTLFRWTKNVTSAPAASFDATTTVRVDRGGIVDCTQAATPPTVAKLAIDPAKGLGTFRNVAFAANAVLRLTTRPTARRTVLGGTFDTAPDVSGWTLDVPPPAAEEREGCFTIGFEQGVGLVVTRRRGFLMIVR